MCVCVFVCVYICLCMCVRAGGRAGGRECVRVCVRACVLYIFVLKMVGELGGMALIFRAVPDIPGHHVPIPTHASCCRFCAASGCCIIGCDSGGNSADSCFRCSCYSGARQRHKHHYLNEMHKTRN